MKDQLYNKSIIATASTTNKSENQDSKDELESEQCNSLFIADGLGSFKYAKFASERVVNFLKSRLQDFNKSDSNFSQINFRNIFYEAKEKLIDFAIENIKDEDSHDHHLYGTTAIVLVEEEEKLVLAYVGNGAIWHIRGNFNEFPASYHFPWNAVNYLNPHSVPEQGKEALYKLISDNKDFSECIPTVIAIEKDKEFGDIIMICTDGIYSADQLKAGKNDKGVWIKYENSMLQFFEYLRHFYSKNQLYNKESIEQTLNLYLADIKPTLDDDATLGILMTKEVLNYQNEINWLKEHEINTSYQL